MVICFSLVNVIPRVDALSDVQVNSFSPEEMSSLLLDAPIFNITDLLLFSLSPETLLYSFIRRVRLLRDCLVPFKKKVASSANDVYLNCVFAIEYPVIFPFLFIALYSNSIAQIKRYGESGHHCLTPFSILKKSDR